MQSGSPDSPALGHDMHRLMSELFPICRSITGNGLRQSLRRLQQVVPLELHEVPSGTPVFDWIVPDEWNVRDAYVKNAFGEKVIDFQASNLHLLNYSIPIYQKMSLAELKPHLYSLSAQPDLIPYRTSYYSRNWGFCLSHRQLQALEEGEYEVFIDSSLQPGSLTYGEYYLPGETSDEVLISCHCCHPSLANDNLSGMALAAVLARQISRQPRRYTYRFVFIPGTIGSITWLALHEPDTVRIKHGLVVTCVGDPGKFTYKKSRRGNAEIDRAAELVLAHSAQTHEIVDFSPYGYDERQYCSPGFNLPIGSLTRTPNGRYPEYHTSLDDLTLVTPTGLEGSLAVLKDCIEVLENNPRYRTTNLCEPQLGKRGLYSSLSRHGSAAGTAQFYLNILAYADGSLDVTDLSAVLGETEEDITKAIGTLLNAKLLERI